MIIFNVDVEERDCRLGTGKLWLRFGRRRGLLGEGHEALWG